MAKRDLDVNHSRAGLHWLFPKPLPLPPLPPGLFYMDSPGNLIPRWRRVLLKVKEIVRPSGDVNEKRIRRRKKLVDLIIRRLTFVK